jgi:outer membrane receptor protein involved in Fe transport
MMKVTAFVRVLCLASLLLLLIPAPLTAGITGKLSGQVVDVKKEPLPSANVVIVGTKLGGVTDLEGYFSVLNIPPGTYTVEIRLIGYRTVATKGIEISANNTTKLDAVLEDEALTTEAVVVTATRPIVDVGATSTTATVTDKDLKALPVQELQDIVNLQAGVVDGHFRGGRDGEVQYQVNGVSVNNVFDNTSTVRIDRSLIQEVQVITGTFDAEYGQAMSGVVNTVLKSGGEHFSLDAEAFGGSFLYGNDGHRNLDYKFRPATTQNYQLSLSGPTGLPQTFFLVNARRYVFDNYLYGTNVFGTQRISPAEVLSGNYRVVGDSSVVPLSYSREWSGLAKLTNKSIPAVEISYQMLFNDIEGKGLGGAWSWRLDPNGMKTQRTRSLVHGFDITHTVSASTFYTVNLRQNYYSYTDWVYDDFFDPRYDLAPYQGTINWNIRGPNDGAVVAGLDLGRYMQKTNTYLAKAAVTSQVTRSHQIKVGGEIQASRMEFGAPGYFINNNGVLVRMYEQLPLNPGARTYHPVSAAAYLQDLIEWNDLTIRAGIRYEYFDGRSTVPAYLANPANAIPGAPAGTNDTRKKGSVAPRLGISYPISTQSSMFFSYGHFYQLPNLRDMYTNADYTRLSGLAAGTLDYGVFGNPDVKPEKTVQYEFGYKNAVTDNLGVTVNLYYKDIRELLGVQFVNTYTGAQYSRLSNIDFGSVSGFTLSIDLRRMGMVNSKIDYTWQMAKGNTSDPQETARLAEAGFESRPQTIPFNWDQRHTLNMTVGITPTEDLNITVMMRYSSGQPYTPRISTIIEGTTTRNSGLKPDGFLVDLRAEKSFAFAGWQWSVFTRVFNLFNARYFNGGVFSSTGSADYSANPEGDRTALLDPTRYLAPRRVELGFSVKSSQ